MSIGIIQNNPFRTLGVFANATKKDIVANQGKMKAFLKVGKKVSFPTDFENLLAPIERTESAVFEADSKITLPKERLKYSQFWFVKSTPEDDAAFKLLSDGDIDAAINVWNDNSSISSIQNRLLCYLIRGDYQQVVNMAIKLYEPFEAEFPNEVVSTNLFDLELKRYILADNETKGIDSVEVFLNTLCEELGAVTVYGLLPESHLKDYLEDLAVKPIIAKLHAEIATAEQSKGKGSEVRYDAGVKLMEDSKPLIEQLREILPTTDTQYELIADKLGLAILDCGIEYYNGSNEETAAKRAMVLQGYAQSIVVGKIAKDRCNENVAILNDIIGHLPPEEVSAEDKEIKELLNKYCNLRETIENAVELLEESKPILDQIRSKFGQVNPYYLYVSTLVVDKALANIIERVNAAQRAFNQVMGDAGTQNDIATKSATLEYFKDVVDDAIRASNIMDGFDMDEGFLMNRYKPNREILEKMHRDLKSAGGTSGTSSSENSGCGCLIYLIIMSIIYLIDLIL